MRKLVVALFLLSLPGFAFGSYVFGIYTDQNPATKAEELKKYLESTAPFNEYDLEVKIFNSSTSDLGCSDATSTTRLVKCNIKEISSKAAKAGIDQAVIISDDSDYGGSGGSVPVITSSPKTPLTMFVHEYMHTIGFGDEYPFPTEAEARTYCTVSGISKYINLTIIEPRREGYADDAEARRVHSSDIPWYSYIKPKTPIFSGTLGTPIIIVNEIGLYRARSCDYLPGKFAIHVWRPDNSVNIMESLSSSVGNLEPLLRYALSSIMKKKTRNYVEVQPPPPEVTNENKIDTRCYEKSSYPLNSKQEKVINQLATEISEK